MELRFLLFYFAIFIPSSIIHEFSHGWMAERLGDHTARYAGRMTLNPKAHVDLWGTLLLPLLLFLATGGQFMFAYAKPMPFNPYNLRDQKWGPALIGLAGPAANFLLALVFGILLRLLPSSELSILFEIIVYANVMLMVFNLIPIPPLDGSKLLFALLPDSMQAVRVFLERYGFVILLFFVFFLFELLHPIIQLIFKWLVG